MKYPIVITPDDNTFLITCPNVPEMGTCVDTLDDVKATALDALITAFDLYIETGRLVPMPSSIEGKEYIEVPLSVWAKVLMVNTMIEQNISKVELARRMGTRKQEVQRIVNLTHNTKIDTLNDAMLAMGKVLILSVNDQH